MASDERDEANSELAAFGTELRRVVGGAIVNGLINPAIILPNIAAAADYSQDSTGNYNQSGGGNHNQVGGDYTQSAAFRNPVILVEQLGQMLAAER